MTIVVSGNASFIDAVNRLLRISQIIRGDDDDITTFSDTQHAANISLAQIAIQDEIGEIVAERLIPYEKASGTVTLASGTRTYALASDFIRFYGSNPSFYDATDNNRIYEYAGGEDILRDVDFSYKTNTGAPNWWYWSDTNSKQVGFYSVPNSTYDTRSLQYDYEKSVMVENSTDVLPFHNNEEFYAFTQAAARRFDFMRSQQPQGLLMQDATYNSAKARLYALLRPTAPSKFYGHGYR